LRQQAQRQGRDINAEAWGNAPGLQKHQAISGESALHFRRWLAERRPQVESRFQRLLLAQSNPWGVAPG
jgi:hypothetical protein